MEAPSYNSNLLNRRNQGFVLWIPGEQTNHQNPRLVLCTYHDTAGPHQLVELLRQDLVQSAQHPALWELAADQLQHPLEEEQVYHYWFEVQDTSPESHNTTIVMVTDPLAFALDYRICMNDDTRQRAPAAIIKYSEKRLWPCDIHGKVPERLAPPASALVPLADNAQLVVYELPTTWVKRQQKDGVEVDRGTFADVQALFDSGAPGDRFAHIAALSRGSILSELGINAVELLPAADAKPTGEWGYATAHYFAPDADLGTAADLVLLAETMQRGGVRLFTDVVTAFGHDPYRFIDFPTFHIRPREEPTNPDSRQCGNNSDQLRQDWGGECWRYIRPMDTYDPATGLQATLTPARAFHLAHLTRWMADFGVSGVRLDSVNNTGSWDFIREYREAAWALWRRSASAAAASKFLVIGEELSMPRGMLHPGPDGQESCLDALWNEPWQKRVRAAIVGRQADDDGGFEETVRRMVDSRADSRRDFTDCTQAVNYITSHDVEGMAHERLCNYLRNCGVSSVERRAKLAHVCLLTSFGIPMILAGEEFCDEHDLPMVKKQVDPVNWSRLEDAWRRNVFDYVKRLVKLRTTCPALGSNDVSILHVDLTRGGRIVAWTRGGNGLPPVVVVANFSDEDTPGSEYFIPNWPDENRGDWREVTQDRDVPRSWIGREPLKHWEAKVYTYWRP